LAGEAISPYVKFESGSLVRWKRTSDRQVVSNGSLFLLHKRISQNNVFFKNNIPSSDSDKGAKGYGIVVFEAVTTIPYSGRNNFNDYKAARNDGIS